ncbi:Protein kinase-like domain protein [Niveomyces insectorum RCEF 264]|uniref:Protein kinase-like domain protein n=1 Tax=Niveomyces insectorum RCEF 264 TaxID=1081102 RepID=A0A167W6X0_9HYPO|nr:Protein kinase-like domain protein [Niveomyces insectorum RCEF 264]
MPKPRTFSDEGYKTVDASTAFEEENLPHYTREAFYPARNGEIIHGRYQLGAKMGYGTSSTVWLAQDLQDGSYWAMKIQVNTIPEEYRTSELEVYRHLKAHGSPNHPGEKHICELRDAFVLQGPNGTHQVLVLTAAGMTLSEFRYRPGNVLSPLMARLAVKQVLLAVNYLHSADVIYTDLHADNLLIGVTDQAVFDKIASLEAKTPSRRKYVDDTVIHSSLGVVASIGPLVLCDMGQARIGSRQEGIAMPAPFRAPEVILGMPWDSKIDMWNLGVLAWNLVEDDVLFQLKAYESRDESNARHLAAMVALLGPPPTEFLNRKRSETSKYWDDQGNWIGLPAVPTGVSFESLAKKLEGNEKIAFIDFVRSLLRWLPEERPISVQAFSHSWVQGKSTADDKKEQREKAGK